MRFGEGAGSSVERRGTFGLLDVVRRPAFFCAAWSMVSVMMPVEGVERLAGVWWATEGL
jgi:hypothetical protein